MELYRLSLVYVEPTRTNQSPRMIGVLWLLDIYIMTMKLILQCSQYQGLSGQRVQFFFFQVSLTYRP